MENMLAAKLRKCQLRGFKAKNSATKAARRFRAKREIEFASY